MRFTLSKQVKVLKNKHNLLNKFLRNKTIKQSLLKVLFRTKFPYHMYVGIAFSPHSLQSELNDITFKSNPLLSLSIHFTEFKHLLFECFALLLDETPESDFFSPPAL